MKEEEFWLARDKDNSLWMHQNKPVKIKETIWSSKGDLLWISNPYFSHNKCSNIRWEDKEPTKIKITLIK